MNTQANVIKTLKVRIKDKHAPVLKQWAFECNQVWNEANAITADYSYVPIPGVGWVRNHFTAFDLQKVMKAIHAKVKNRRADHLHKFTTQLVRENSLIVVGNVSSKALVKTNMAKSVLDAGWSMLKTQLDAKSKAMQGVFLEVNEAYSTQACSCCGSISASSPKGRAGLGIREWTCADCGTLHDRDVNAARNILAAGHCRLAGGIPFL